MIKSTNLFPSYPDIFVLEAEEVFLETETLTYTHRYERTHTIPIPNEHLREFEPANLEVDEVTTGASLLMGMSPTI